jgi:hypothetical protein
MQTDDEKGARATISIAWNDIVYGGMLQNRTFKIVLVRGNHGIGRGLTNFSDRTVPALEKRL